MAEPYQCLVCGMTEDKCDCTRYCCICQGYYDVRLVQDGQYYCQACREACEYQAQG
jgi:hypothetical protein